MICPKCLIQMHQHNQEGGGVSEDEKYETWEIKICPSCGRKVKEYYSVTVVNENKNDVEQA